jgi:hypothetical protein
MIRKLVLGTVLFAILAVNPMFGCFAVHFDYSEADMKKAIEGQWKLTIDHRELEMSVREAKSVKRHASNGIVNSAAACGTRSFMNTAEACIDASSMDVEIVIAGVTSHGTFRVFSTSFERGLLETEVDGVWLDADVDSLGQVLEVRAAQNNNKVTVALARM